MFERCKGCRVVLALLPQSTQSHRRTVSMPLAGAVRHHRGKVREHVCYTMQQWTAHTNRPTHGVDQQEKTRQKGG